MLNANIIMCQSSVYCLGTCMFFCFVVVFFVVILFFGRSEADLGLLVLLPADVVFDVQLSVVVPLSRELLLQMRERESGKQSYWCALESGLDIEASQPEWCISSMIYSRDTSMIYGRDTPFWSGTLDMYTCTQVVKGFRSLTDCGSACIVKYERVPCIASY